MTFMVFYVDEFAEGWYAEISHNTGNIMQPYNLSWPYTEASTRGNYGKK